MLRLARLQVPTEQKEIRMKKSTALYKILNFGRKEEHQLIAEGKIHEAYQIEAARRQLVYALLDTVKHARDLLNEMCKPLNEAHPLAYVADELTRNLLIELKKNF